MNQPNEWTTVKRVLDGILGCPSLYSEQQIEDMKKARQTAEDLENPNLIIVTLEEFNELKRLKEEVFYLNNVIEDIEEEKTYDMINDIDSKQIGREIYEVMDNIAHDYPQNETTLKLWKIGKQLEGGELVLMPIEKLEKLQKLESDIETNRKFNLNLLD